MVDPVPVAVLQLVDLVAAEAETVGEMVVGEDLAVALMLAAAAVADKDLMAANLQ